MVDSLALRLHTLSYDHLQSDHDPNLNSIRLLICDSVYFTNHSHREGLRILALVATAIWLI